MEDSPDYNLIDALGSLEFETAKGILRLKVEVELEQGSGQAKFKAFGEVVDANPAQGVRYELESLAFEGENGKVAKIKGSVKAVRGSNLQPDKELGEKPIGTMGLFAITNPKSISEHASEKRTR